MLSAIDGSYGAVVQDLRPWVAKAPQLPPSGRTAAEAAGIDVSPPPSDLREPEQPGLEVGESRLRLSDDDGEPPTLQVSENDVEFEFDEPAKASNGSELLTWTSVAEREGQGPSEPDVQDVAGGSGDDRGGSTAG